MRGIDPFTAGHDDDISPDQSRGCFCSDEKEAEVEELTDGGAVVDEGRAFEAAVDEGSSTTPT